MQSGIRLHQYLDDWVIRAPSEQQCMVQTQKTTKAGEKLELYSKPQEVRTRTISEVRLPRLPFLLDLALVKPTQDRWTKLQEMFLVGIKAHDVRAFAAFKAFYGGISMDQIMQACHWKSHNTFTRFYLRDLARQDQSEGSFHLDAFIAVQQMMPPSNQVPGKKKEGGARHREPPRRGVSEP